MIVPFDNPDAIAESVVALLENDAERHAMRRASVSALPGNNVADDRACHHGCFSAGASRAVVKGQEPHSRTMPPWS